MGKPGVMDAATRLATHELADRIWYNVDEDYDELPRPFRNGLTEDEAEDRDACMVAADMLEEGRPIEQIRKLLDEQAPRRLNRKCPACGSSVGELCLEPDWDNAGSSIDETGVRVWEPANVVPPRDRLIPHLSRLTVDSGPLFGDPK